jgi:Family of unknown function (DUF6082)
MDEHETQPPRRHKQLRVGRWPLIVATALIIAAAFLFGTPFVLLAISHIRPKDWAQFSNEGQAYGGIAAAFGMLALIGVVASLVLQSRESAANRAAFQRSIHNDLMSKALDDEALRACWGRTHFKDSEQERQHIYTNLIFSFWHSMFEIGKLTDHDLRDVTSRIFNGAPGRRYWSISGPHMIRFHSSSRRDARFVEIVEQEYRKALGRERSLGSERAALERPRRGPADHRSTIRALILGTATGALVSAFMAKARALSRSSGNSKSRHR